MHQRGPVFEEGRNFLLHFPDQTWSSDKSVCAPALTITKESSESFKLGRLKGLKMMSVAEGADLYPTAAWCFILLQDPSDYIVVCGRHGWKVLLRVTLAFLGDMFVNDLLPLLFPICFRPVWFLFLTRPDVSRPQNCVTKLTFIVWPLSDKHNVLWMC